MKEIYFQHKNKVIEDSRFKHTMALSLNPKTNFKDGLIRCITQRIGDVQIRGFKDKSVLYKVKSKNSLTSYEITEPLNIFKQDDVIKNLSFDDLEFIGLEDPDIFIDDTNDLTHLFFTIPFVNKEKGQYRIYLGHAQGKDLESLEMSDPVLPSDNVDVSAKEVSIAPVNSNGERFNLFESRSKIDNRYYSTIRVARVKNLNKNWKLEDYEIHPNNLGYKWCEGHVSPGPLLSREFIDIGKDKRLGIVNGREANRDVDGKRFYGIFSVGLFIFNIETGRLEWISEKPLIRDTQARTITFASQFVQKDKNEGILYAHVDDSFVRAYSIFSSEIKKIIP